MARASEDQIQPSITSAAHFKLFFPCSFSPAFFKWLVSMNISCVMSARGGISYIIELRRHPRHRARFRQLKQHFQFEQNTKYTQSSIPECSLSVYTLMHTNIPPIPRELKTVAPSPKKPSLNLHIVDFKQHHDLTRCYQHSGHIYISII